MEIKYEKVGSQDGLVLYGFSSTTEFLDESSKVWNFIWQHNHHVLRPFHRECKTAGVQNYHIDESNYNPEKLPLLVFGSEWEQHKRYVDILKVQLGLEIKGLPLVGLVIKEQGVTPMGYVIQTYSEIDSADEPYVEDLEKMVSAFKEAGYEISVLTAYAAHCLHDNDLSASWLELPCGSEIVKTYLPYMLGH